MLAITYSMKKEIKVAKWGTPKKYLKKLKTNFRKPRKLRGPAFPGLPATTSMSHLQPAHRKHRPDFKNNFFLHGQGNNLPQWFSTFFRLRHLLELNNFGDTQFIYSGIRLLLSQ